MAFHPKAFANERQDENTENETTQLQPLGFLNPFPSLKPLTHLTSLCLGAMPWIGPLCMDAHDDESIEQASCGEVRKWS